jgi:hypothetical protein
LRFQWLQQLQCPAPIERMTDRLRVGMLAPVAWRVPPLHYGPWERVVSILTEGLVARGVDVTLPSLSTFGEAG